MATAKKNIFARAFSLLPSFGGVHAGPQNIPQVKSDAHDPKSFMIPLQLERIKTDLMSWRLAVSEAENAYYPHRFRMQQLFVDIILEGHTKSVIKKRKSLALQKEYRVGKKNAEGQWVENKEATLLFHNKKWFRDLLSYALDAQFFGYSLIQLGDLVVSNGDYNFKNLTVLKRWHVSPDRKQLVQIPYQTWGLNIEPTAMPKNSPDMYGWGNGLEAIKQQDKANSVNFAEDLDDNGVPFDDWMVYVDTPSDVGSSICGFGMLYDVSFYSIIAKSNIQFNSNYNQMFVAPFRHIKTQHRFDSDEYKTLERSAALMGSFGYLLTDSTDEVNFLQGNSGTGYQSYEDLERRCNQAISKLILGHADAIDSHARSLGGGSGGQKTMDEDSTPEGRAIAEIDKEQTQFILSVLNDIIYRKLMKLGFPLKADEIFYCPNDKEDFEMRKKADAANLVTAQVYKTAKEAGLKLDPEKFENITGIEAEAIDEPVHTEGVTKMAAKLKAMYSHKHKK